MLAVSSAIKIGRIFDQPQFDHASYVLSVETPSSAISKGTHLTHEFLVSESTDISMIIAIYEIRPYQIHCPDFSVSSRDGGSWNMDFTFQFFGNKCIYRKIDGDELQQFLSPKDITETITTK